MTAGPNRRLRPDDHQRAVEACQHAVDALRNGNLYHIIYIKSCMIELPSGVVLFA